MILEYLFLDNAIKESVKDYNSEYIGTKVTVTYLEPETKNYWAVRYAIKGETKDGAKALSDINDKFTKCFQPITLINESAEYYKRRRELPDNAHCRNQ